MACFVTRFALAIIASAVCIATASQMPAEESKPVSFALFAPGQSEKTISALTELFTHGNKNASVSLVKNLPDAIASKADIAVLALSVKEFNSLGPYDADALKKRKVIGISYGAAKLYGEIGLKISWGACAHGMEPRIKVVDNATIAKAGFDKVFGVYAPNAPQYPASDVEYMPFGIFDGFPAIHKGLEDVDVVARFNGDLGYAPIVRQGNKILIGFNPHAEDWTEQFGDLMRKVAAALNEPLKNPVSQPVATHAPQTLGAARTSSAADQPPVLTTIGEAKVPAQEAGVVVSINVKKGQFVKKGDLIAQIDDAISQAEKRKAMADRNAAKEKADSDSDIRYATAAAEVAKYEYLKNKEAYDTDKNSVPWVEVKRLELAWQRAIFQIEKSRVEQRVNKLTVDAKAAEVEAAEEAIRHRQIKAPLDGIVVDITPHEGEWVKPGDTVMHIVRLDRLQVEGYLKSSQ